jgi:hypothetical protein
MLPAPGSVVCVVLVDGGSVAARVSGRLDDGLPPPGASPRADTDRNGRYTTVTPA